MSGRGQRLSLRGGRLLDPANGLDRIADLHVADGQIVAIGDAPKDFDAGRVLEVAGCHVVPGITDLMVRPGSLGRLEQELGAAAAGGITQVVCPPDLSPVLDHAAMAGLVQGHAIRAGAARVLTLGALTIGLQGSRLSEMHALAEAGCIGMTQLHHPLQDHRTLLRCLEYAATCEVPVFFRPLDAGLAAGGCAHEGPVATRHGLRGIPHSAETTALARDLLLVEQVGVRAHFGQLSSARSVELIAAARARGLDVTADVTVHHLLFDAHAVEGFNSLFHVDPPLRDPADREALLAGVREGIVSAICSDHRPLEAAAKHAPFAASEAGLAGTESLLGAVLRLVEEGALALDAALERLGAGPGRIAAPGWQGLACGAVADLCVYDPAATTTLEESTLKSRGVNNPFLGEALPGRVRYTLRDGEVIHAS